MNNCNLYKHLLFVIAAQLATQVIVSAETDGLYDELCRENWFPRKGKCFFISKDSSNFYEAKEKCQSMDSAIAPVASNDDQYLLISVLVDRSKKCPSYENCADFWIGVFDAETRNVWTTTDGRSISEVQRYWVAGYPKAKGTCVQMHIQHHKQDIRAWKNENCAKSLKYVCVTSQKIRPTTRPTTTTTTTTTTTPKPSRYRIITRPMAWSNAFSECMKFGSYASLAQISSAKENHEISMFLKKEIAKSGKNCEHFWIGARRQDSSCQTPFIWLIQHGQEIPMKYSAWSTDQPDCAGGGEACVHMRKLWDYKWNDQSCNDLFCAVCELHQLN